MLKKDEDLKHVIYEGFSEVPGHPRLLREDQVILGHEETVEEGFVCKGTSVLLLFEVRIFCQVDTD